MKIRPNVKYLIKKYCDQISEWRTDGPLVASWEQICREICSREKLTGTDRPTGDGLRKAWAKQSATSQTSQNSEKTQTIQTNRLESTVVKPFATKTEAAERPDKSQTSQNSETTQTIQKLQTNTPPTRTNPRTGYVPTLEEWESWPLEKKLEHGIPVCKPDGSRYMRPLKSDEAKLLRRDARAAAFDAGEL